MNITRAELKAAIDEAHRHHLKLTGHLCSVTYPEAVELGIDNLEHGFFVNTQLDPGKQPDKCPDTAGNPTLLKMKPGSPEANALIKLLVDHHVAITSTLPVFEQSVPLHAPLQARQMEVLTPQAKESYLYLRNLTAGRAGTPRGQQAPEGYRNDLGLERQFVAAGGLLALGANLADLYRRSAAHVDKILKGASPAGLPVEQPVGFKLLVNLKTARALDLQLPPTLVALADEVIE